MELHALRVRAGVERDPVVPGARGGVSPASPATLARVTSARRATPLLLVGAHEDLVHATKRLEGNGGGEAEG